MFAQVVIQSAAVSVPFRTYEGALSQGQMFADSLGCDVNDINCMRNKSAREVFQASMSAHVTSTSSFLVHFEEWSPVVDGDEVSDNLYSEFVEHEHFSQKPAIVGTVADEGLIFVRVAMQNPVTIGEYYIMLWRLKAENDLIVYSKYSVPQAQFADTRSVITSVVTDFGFICPMRSIARKLQEYQNVWKYSFEHAIGANGFWGPVKSCENRVCHGADIPILFQTLDRTEFPMSEDERDLSNSFINYIANFIKTGNPNSDLSKNITQWPIYNNTVTENKEIVFKVPELKIIKDYKVDECDLWDSIAPYEA